MSLTKKYKILLAAVVGVIMLTAVVITVVLLTTKSESTSNKEHTASSFYVVPLGTEGGLDESDLSSYLLTSVNTGQPNSAYIALDGGTIRHGVDVAIREKILLSATDTETFIRSHIKAYLISHGHLDHLSGFLLNTPNDQARKSIVAMNETINIIQEHYFNGQAWADFGAKGLKTYDYQILDPENNVSEPIANTDFNVRLFRLCHTCPYLSSAFLVSRRNVSSASILYLGDTGPDDIEKIPLPNNQTSSPRYLEQMWKEVAPLVANGELKAIFIEVSYVNDRPDQLLFGHLTPKWLLKELRILKGSSSMKNVQIIVTHIKPEKDARATIMQQLNEGGAGDFTFVLPEQGKPIWL